MSRLYFKYVLVGAGPAAGAAAEGIRLRDPTGTILMVGLEVNRPYRRPALSKEFLSGNARSQELFTLDDGWFAAHGVELRTGRRAAQLDLTHRAVMLENGDAIAFDRMLLATGASPRHLKIPGAEMPGVHYVRRIEDADRLHNAIEKAKHEGRRHETGRGKAVIVGSGLLALDLACTLSHIGLGVDVVFGSQQFLPDSAGVSVGRFLQGHLERHGVKVHAGVSALRVEGDGRAQRVVLSDGKVLDCDLVTPALGNLPNKELIRHTSIKAEKNVLVDQYCQTNVEGVYAAGDVAAVLDPVLGKYRPLDHWESALETGALAGRNMAGANEAYIGVNHFQSNLWGVMVEVWGESRHIDRRIVRGSTSVESPDFVEFGVTANALVTLAVTVSHASERERIRQMVRERQSIEGREESLKDPGVAL